MGFDLDVTIPAITVFVQGLLSFFSPCVLPIVPLYAGYLSGGGTVAPDGTVQYSQKVILRNTVFFILGVSFAFFSLGLGFSALGMMFTENQMVFSRIGGILIILLGLMQLGVFDHPFHGGEVKLPIKLNMLKMSPMTALLMGFTFSFAWTPCVGPALSTVLIMIAGAQSSLQGLWLMGVYTLGFTIPFLLVGVFTTQCLNFFKAHRNVVAYTTKIGAVIMILMGLMMFTGTMNSITGYLSKFGTETTPTTSVESESITEDIVATESEPTVEEETETESESSEETESLPVISAVDFSLQDQYGNIHTLSDYEGKTIFLNMWATWCSPCKQELPDIQKLYEAYGENQGDVIILGVAFPNDENQHTQEGSVQDVTDFLEENEYTYPTLMDVSSDLLYGYGISAFPTTFMIDVDGNIFGYVAGMMTYDIMESIIQQTVEGTRK